MLLMSLGYYTPIINRISGFLAALPALKWEELFACAAVLIPFGIGVVLGIFLVSKLVEYLLKKQERKTYFAIMGLVTSPPIKSNIPSSSCPKPIETIFIPGSVVQCC